MKKLVLILVASFALVVARDFNNADAWTGDNGGIPLSKLAGNYAGTGQGSITICFAPDFSTTEACTTPDAVGLVFNDPSVSSSSWDKVGNFCGTNTDVGSIPGDVSPPVATIQRFVGKVTSYDPSTASGDISFSEYTGGKCTGSKFNSAGATLNNTVTTHFVASNSGERFDFVVTTLTDPAGDFGAVSVSGFSLKQQH